MHQRRTDATLTHKNANQTATRKSYAFDYIKVLTAVIENKFTPQWLYRLSGNAIHIGRAEDNDIAIMKDRGVSRNHAIIRFNNNEYFIEDC